MYLQYIIFLDNKLVTATSNKFLSYILREKKVRFSKSMHNFRVYNDATQLCRLQQEASPDIECIINNRGGESRSIHLDRRAPEYSTRSSFCRWRGRSYLSHPSKTRNYGIAVSPADSPRPRFFHNQRDWELEGEVRSNKRASSVARTANREFARVVRENESGEMWSII